jgi:hypothetical protein
MVRPHQPGEALFKAILPEDIDWRPFPAFPPSVRLAVLVGEPIPSSHTYGATFYNPRLVAPPTAG